MATFIPSIAEILRNQMEVPTNGELALLHQLGELSDDYVVYFQSHINTSHPDIVIVKENCGVIIIEVKDWNLNAYEFSGVVSSRNLGTLRERRGLHEVRNPFEQASFYKNELFQMYSSALYLGSIDDTKTYGVVKAGVYFANASEQQVKQLFGRENFNGNNFAKYYPFWANDSENLVGDIEQMLRPNRYFTQEIYRQVTSVFTPSVEWREQSEFFTLSKEQNKFAKSEAGERKKIKGVAGSGKTLVLAARAVNCYRRLHDKVLILTFNVTLQNYIHDKISQRTRDLSTRDRNQFIIMPIFDFVKYILDENGIDYSKEVSDDPMELLRMRFELLEQHASQIKQRYKAILIDEVQDFEFDWLCKIEKLFLAPNGEFVLFGDEKQNIYNRAVDEKKLPHTSIRGPWSSLKESYRLARANCELATAFQTQFFEGKYEKTPVEYRQMTFADMNRREEMRYYQISQEENMTDTIFRIIEDFRNVGTQIAWNDICMLTDNCEVLRDMEYYLKNVRHIDCKTICETREEYAQLRRAYEQGRLGRRDFKMELHKLRKIKKNMFFMNPGVMKLSTIQSFKGWEIDTIVLILEEGSQLELQDELIYTAITRAKNNLVIINMGNERYHEFFRQKIAM